VIAAMRQTHPELPLVAKSNAGMPELVGDRAVYSGSPELMASYARRVRALGATVIGACCGSSPAHIRAMASALRQAPPLDPADLGPVETAERRVSEGRRERRERRG
jgi:5-methyltetrahydrofolate--homocysteine methyltransferase